MTIGIAIPLKSRKISRDWQVTSDSLEATIQSIIAQSNPDYKIVIVGHDCPDFLIEMNNEKITFKFAEFPEPDRSHPDFTTLDLINDKRLKIISALIELKKYSVDYIFQLDSDDLIHKDFIKTIKAKEKTSAMIIKRGYLFYKSANRYMETEEMDQLCGSIAIVATDAFTMPEKVDLECIHDLPWTKYRHMSIYKFFETDTKQPFIFLEEKLLAYVLASGDNFSDRWRDNWFKRFKWMLKPYIKGKKIDHYFKESFLG